MALVFLVLHENDYKEHHLIRLQECLSEADQENLIVRDLNIKDKKKPSWQQIAYGCTMVDMLCVMPNVLSKLKGIHGCNILIWNKDNDNWTTSYISE